MRPGRSFYQEHSLKLTYSNSLPNRYLKPQIERSISNILLYSELVLFQNLSALESPESKKFRLELKSCFKLNLVENAKWMNNHLVLIILEFLLNEMINQIRKNYFSKSENYFTNPVISSIYCRFIVPMKLRRLKNI